MTAIAACSRSPAARRRSTPAPGSTGPTNSPRSPRRPARSTATAPCSTARSSRSTTRAIPASRRCSRRSREGGARPHPVPVRRARDRRREARQAAQPRAQAAPRRADRRGPAALHPLCRPYHRQGRAIVRGDVRGRPGRDHLQEGRRALPPRAHEELAQDQMHAPPGIRHHRLDARATRRAAASARCCSALNEGGKLRYAGKVGTGFSQAVQHDLRDRARQARRPTRPPAQVPRAEARGAHWVKPELVAEIAFAEFTADNVVRHASFLGLRGDKKAKEVVAEMPQAAARAAPRTTSRSPTPTG